VPEEESAGSKVASSAVTYGRGMIPLRSRIGATEWTTSLFPKNGLYVVPLKDAVRTAERLEVGDQVTLRLIVDARW